MEPRPARSHEDLRRRLARARAGHPLHAFLEHRARLTFYRQLLSLIRAGTGMPEMMRDLARHAPDRRLGTALERVGKSVARGATIGQAMERETAVFDDPALPLLAAGEESGMLERAIGEIIEYLVELQRVRWQLVLIAIYPLYLVLGYTFFAPLLEISLAIGAGTAKGGLLAVYLRGLFRNLLILATSLGLLTGWPFLVAAADAELGWDRLKLRLPVLGRASRSLYASRLLLALSFALRAGMPIARMLRMAASAPGSAFVRSRAAAAIAIPGRGGTLTDAMVELEILDRMTLAAIAVGERAGDLDRTLPLLAAGQRDAALRATRALSIGLVAALAVLIVGLLIAGILGVVFGPIWQWQHLPDGV